MLYYLIKDIGGGGDTIAPLNCQLPKVSVACKGRIWAHSFTIDAHGHEFKQVFTPLWT